ncbi:MAG TPA: DUF4198 domain-containing protein [Proteobacteria bacterium]|nr:DUF4198 domain-containing protein [Pseudomonadota bacterium]
MRRKPVFLLCLVILGLGLFVRPVLAHNLWLNPDNYFPALGSTVSIGIGWGHKYPADRNDEKLKAGRLEAIQALAPDGREVELEKVSETEYRLKIDQAGAYVVTARIKPSFFTMTPEGRKWGNKQEVADADKCTNFHLEAKTVLQAGAGARDSQLTGQTLELRPLSDLAALKAGDKLVVQLFYAGQPLAGATINATDAGFVDASASKSATKDAHSAHHHPVSVVTDSQGRAELTLARAGYWLLLFSHKPPYQDTTICDQYLYNVTFSCEVR